MDKTPQQVKIEVPPEYSKGWKDGNKAALALPRPWRSDDFSKNFVHRGSLYDRRFAEGVISAELNKLNKK